LISKRVLAILAVLATAAVWRFWTWRDARGSDPRSNSRSSTSMTLSSVYKNTVKNVAFVGDEVCARCHAEIAAAYHHHPMGRSMVTPKAVLPEVRGVVFEVNELVYSIDRRGGRLFHQETRKDGSGGVLAKIEAEVRYVIGSGTRGYSFLVERGGSLFQSPIAWYAQKRTWGLPPSYQVNNLHFDRPITQGCLFCHTNQFEPIEGKPPVFHGLTIGCERCHGPGELHSQRPEVVGGKDLTIVNPVDLEPKSLRENVCEQCHFQGTDRLEWSERSSFDYRPGLPLEKFLLISSSRFDPYRRHSAVGHVEQMRESECYRASGGDLGCTSCHDPHRLPAPASRVAYYRRHCLECHSDRGCSLSRPARLAQSPDDDCVACHMPRATTTNIAHTALTNHTIPRHAPPTR
jgi:hypothetical protein